MSSEYGLLDLPDLVLENICFWAADWRALRCCKVLNRICYRWNVITRINLKGGVFCWRQKQFLHELASCKMYGMGEFRWPIAEANYILGHMYFAEGDYSNAWGLLDYYFHVGGKPYFWLSKGICVIGTGDVRTDDKWIRAIYYIHIDVCQHIRVALSVVGCDCGWKKIESSRFDALKVSRHMRLGVRLADVVFPLDSDKISIADTVCNSDRVDMADEYSLTIEENIGALAVLDNYITPQPWSIMEIYDSVRRISLTRSA